MKKTMGFPWVLCGLLIFGCAEKSGTNFPVIEKDASAQVDVVGASDGSTNTGDGAAADTAASDGQGGDASVDATSGACEPNGVVPPARSEMMGVFDPERRRLVYFGGDNGVPVNCQSSSHPVGLTDLWVYDAVCATFEEVPYEGGPSGRARGMAVYDSGRDQMVVFGGRYRQAASGAYTVFNDTWALDLETFTWTELQTQGVPIARSNPAGAYNRLTNEMLIFGGNSSNNGLAFGPLGDVMALNLETLVWRTVATSAPRPEARLFHAAALDEEGDRFFVYGGGDAGAWTGPFLGDLWVLDLATSQWEELHAGGPGAPQARIWSTITYDKIGDRVLLFGGHDDGTVGNNNDTWEFDLGTNTWSEVVSPDTYNKPANGFCNFPPDFTLPNLDAPDRRQGHLAALDPTRGEWIVHGGKTDCGIIDDVWTFDLARDEWVRLYTANQGEACLRGETPEMCLALCQ